MDLRLKLIDPLTWTSTRLYKGNTYGNFYQSITEGIGIGMIAIMETYCYNGDFICKQCDLSV